MSGNEDQKKEGRLDRTFQRPLIRGLPADVPGMSLEESYRRPQQQTLWESMKKHPFIPLGMMCAGLLVFKAFRGFKTRGQVVRDPADYIVHYRVPIQATVVITLVLEVWNSGYLNRSRGKDE